MLVQCHLALIFGSTPPLQLTHMSTPSIRADQMMAQSISRARLRLLRVAGPRDSEADFSKSYER